MQVVVLVVRGASCKWAHCLLCVSVFRVFWMIRRLGLCVSSTEMMDYCEHVQMLVNIATMLPNGSQQFDSQDRQRYNRIRVIVRRGIMRTDCVCKHVKYILTVFSQTSIDVRSMSSATWRPHATQNWCARSLSSSSSWWSLECLFRGDLPFWPELPVLGGTSGDVWRGRSVNDRRCWLFEPVPLTRDRRRVTGGRTNDIMSDTTGNFTDPSYSAVFLLVQMLVRLNHHWPPGNEDNMLCLIEIRRVLIWSSGAQSPTERTNHLEPHLHHYSVHGFSKTTLQIRVQKNPSHLQFETYTVLARWQWRTRGIHSSSLDDGNHTWCTCWTES